jgi:hypothetical protein
MTVREVSSLTALPTLTSRLREDYRSGGEICHPLEIISIRARQLCMQATVTTEKTFVTPSGCGGEATWE